MRRNDRAIARFATIGHATFHCYELAIPLFVVVWLDAFDVSPALLGTVVAVGYALVGVGAPPSGALADAYGSKRLVVASMLGMGGGFALLALAPTVRFLALALAVWGAAASLYHPAGLSLITRGASRRGTVLAYHGVAGNVGTAFGPLAAAIALTLLDWRLVAGLFVLPAVVGALAASRVAFDERAAVEVESGPNTAATGGRSPDAGAAPPPPTAGDVADPTASLLARTLTLFAGGFALAFAVAVVAGTYYRGLFTFLPDVLAGLPAFEPVVVVGETVSPGQYVYAGLLLIGAAGQYVGGRLSDRRSPERAIIVVFAALLVATLSFPMATAAGLAATLVACAALGFLVFAEVPIHQALIGEYAGADVHGLSFGLTYLGVFGIGALGASIAGIALTYGGTALLFASLAAFPAAGAVLAAVLVARGRGE